MKYQSAADQAVTGSVSEPLKSTVRYIPASRRGKRAVVAHVEPAAAWQLKKLALDQQTTVQKLLEESLADLFDKYHLPPVAI